jgi:hypothetical protein
LMLLIEISEASVLRTGDMAQNTLMTRGTTSHLRGFRQ